MESAGEVRHRYQRGGGSWGKGNYGGESSHPWSRRVEKTANLRLLRVLKLGQEDFLRFGGPSPTLPDPTLAYLSIPYYNGNLARAGRAGGPGGASARSLGMTCSTSHMLAAAVVFLLVSARGSPPSYAVLGCPRLPSNSNFTLGKF